MIPLTGGCSSACAIDGSSVQTLGKAGSLWGFKKALTGTGVFHMLLAEGKDFV